MAAIRACPQARAATPWLFYQGDLWPGPISLSPSVCIPEKGTPTSQRDHPLLGAFLLGLRQS